MAPKVVPVVGYGVTRAGLIAGGRLDADFYSPERKIARGEVGRSARALTATFAEAASVNAGWAKRPARREKILRKERCLVRRSGYRLSH